MILVALVIVAYLARTALTGLGLAPGATATKAGTPAERALAPDAGGIEALDPGPASAAPASVLERARGVEDLIKHTDERAAQADGQAPR